MSTLKTHNLQSPDSGSVNIALAPNAGMVVAGVSTFTGAIDANGNIAGQTAAFSQNIAIRLSSATNNLHVHQDDSDKSILQFSNTTTGTATGDGFQIGISGDEEAVLDMKESKPIIFSSAGSETLRITSTGYLKVTNGSTSDFNTIQRASTSNYSGIRIQDADATQRMQIGVAGGTNQIATGAAQHDAVLKSYANLLLATNQTERLRIDSSGRVQIGASNNTGSHTKLVVGAGNNVNTTAIINTGDVDTNALTLSNWDGAQTSNKVMISFDNSGRGSFAIGMPAASADFAFFAHPDAAGSERFRITSAGNVGIGTNAPSQIFNICGTNVKPVIGHITAHTPLYSSYDSQNNTGLEISSSGTGTNVAGLTINNPTTSANSSYKTISFSCSGTSSSDKRGCIISSNHDLDSSSAIKANFKVMVNNGSGLQDGILIGHQGHVQTSNTAMFSARGQNATWSSFSSGSGWYALGDTTSSGSNYTHNHSWTTSGTGCQVRGLTNAGNSIWNNSTAVFTAPVDGFYNFEISLYIRTNGGANTMHVQPWVGGSNTGFYTSNVGNIRNSSNVVTGDTLEYPHVARSINLYLTNGQTFYWLVYAINGKFESYRSYAHQSGYLIG